MSMSATTGERLIIAHRIHWGRVLLRVVAWLAAFALIYGLGLFLFEYKILQTADGLMPIVRTDYARMCILAAIFVIATVSLNLVIGFTGQFSLGHAAFMAVGGYTAALLTRDFNTPFPLALLTGGIIAAVLGVLVGLPTLRLRGDYLAIATLGMGEIMRVVFENIDRLGGASGFSGIMPPNALFGLGSDFMLSLWGWSVLCMMLCLLCVSHFIRSSHGRACIAVREDELAAETMGINTVAFKVLAFTVAAFFAGVAGGLLAHFSFTIKPDSAGFLKSVEVLIMVVLGGLGSITGSVLSATGLTVINNVLSSYVEPRMVIYAVLLVVLMIVRPYGLWQKRNGEPLRFPFFRRREGRDVV